MTTIVMNTTNAAVTEYDWTHTSISPAHLTDDNGLYTIGGDTDAGTAISATVLTGKIDMGSGKKKMIDKTYLGLQGSGTGQLRVEGQSTTYGPYTVSIRAKGMSSAQPGRGIRENYLALGYSNVSGADFRLDRIDADLTESSTRRSN